MPCAQLRAVAKVVDVAPNPDDEDDFGAWVTQERTSRASRSGRPLSPVRLGVLVFSGTLVVLTAALLLFVYKIHVLPSDSMAPTLPIHSAIAINRLDRSADNGDIIVFGTRDSYEGAGGEFLARVIARQGQTVACCTHGAVTREGKALKEPYTMPGDDETNFPTVTVPKGRLWVMGDHRSQSADSRIRQSDPHHGTVAQSDVTGTVAFHGSRVRAYAWVIERAALLAAALGIMAGLAMALLRGARNPHSN